MWCKKMTFYIDYNRTDVKSHFSTLIITKINVQKSKK